MNFLQIKKLKTTKLICLKKEVNKMLVDEFYSIKFIEQYNFNEISNLKLEKQGVYIVYIIDNNSLVFSYVGTSKNIYRRWKQHLYKLNSKNRKYYKWLKILKQNNKQISDLRFAIVFENDNLQECLKIETINIMKLKNKFYSANTRNCDRKLHCINGHGMQKISLIKNKDNSSYSIQCLCLNKKCRNRICYDKYGDSLWFKKITKKNMNLH